ncbi:18088_t:CDS:1, partial [Gigaspora rosea]
TKDNDDIKNNGTLDDDVKDEKRWHSKYEAGPNSYTNKNLNTELLSMKWQSNNYPTKGSNAASATNTRHHTSKTNSLLNDDTNK